MLNIMRTILTAMLLLLASCAEQSENAPAEPAPISREAQTIILTMNPEGNLFQQKRNFTPLIALLKDIYPISVIIHLEDSYGSIPGSLYGMKAHGAVFDPYSYVVTSEKMPLIPVVSGVGTDGITHHEVIIITHRPDITASPSTWRGRTVAVAHKKTDTNIFFELTLMKSGVSTDSGADMLYTGSHENSLFALANGQADIAVITSRDMMRLNAVAPQLAGRLRILHRSLPLPSMGIALTKAATYHQAMELKDTLLSVSSTHEHTALLHPAGVDSFVPMDPSAYRPMEVYLREYRRLKGVAE